MKKKAYKTRKGKISVSGNLPRPGQKGPGDDRPYPAQALRYRYRRLLQTIRAADNVDYPRRFRLYDMYIDILMDPHLTSVIEKRKNAVLSSVIEFRRDGKPDKRVNEQIRSPWFRRLVSDIIDAKIWGFSLMQFYRRGEWIDYDLIPRKHADPVRRLILRHQTDTTGTSWDEYPDLLFVGNPDDLGLLAKAAIWVIYKRSDVADWAQFAEVFGAPTVNIPIPRTTMKHGRGHSKMQTRRAAWLYSYTPPIHIWNFVRHRTRPEARTCMTGCAKGAIMRYRNFSSAIR